MRHPPFSPPSSAFPLPLAHGDGPLIGGTAGPSNGPVHSLEVFGPSGRHRLSLRAARAFIEALFSSDDVTAAPADRMDWLQGELDGLLCKASWRPGGVYKLLLLLICFVSPLHLGRPQPLWRLSVADRVRALRAMERGPLASVVLAAKAIICMIYYEHPAVARECGYTGGSLRQRGGPLHVR